MARASLRLAGLMAGLLLCLAVISSTQASPRMSTSATHTSSDRHAAMPGYVNPNAGEAKKHLKSRNRDDMETSRLGSQRKGRVDQHTEAAKRDGINGSPGAGFGSYTGPGRFGSTGTPAAGDEVSSSWAAQKDSSRANSGSSSSSSSSSSPNSGTGVAAQDNSKATSAAAANFATLPTLAFAAAAAAFLMSGSLC
ncbi:hypothetical protein IE53DRAFT_31916 [Violaceomyces palustris]|uniref:Uncharacterized protein n=1 Tax=Violaceomyces palustris TaxID=1673888 RepID=A0ACD0NL05_9BASI|nr:hypothetical protein IE53DRAFT_31916 [Violaceomyces palustris]